MNTGTRWRSTPWARLGHVHAHLLPRQGARGGVRDQGAENGVVVSWRYGIEIVYVQARRAQPVRLRREGRGADGARLLLRPTR